MAESTWKSVSSLPQSLIEDYEAGVKSDIQQYSFSSGGQTIHTLLTVQKDNQHDIPPDSKRPRLCNSIESSNTGMKHY